MPIYEYECRDCGPFSEARPMAASALPSVCPRCAAEASRVLSATAVAIGRGSGGARRRKGGGAEPSVVTVKDRREPPTKTRLDPLRAPRRPHEAARPWMVGH